MILNEMKELEDAKQELAKLDSEFSREFLKDKQRIFEELKEEFKSFITEGGFSLTARGGTLVGEYGTAKLELEFPKLEAFWAGGVTFLKFTATNQRMAWDILILNKASANSGVSVTSITNTGIAGELEATKQSIERRKKRLPYTAIDYEVCYAPNGANRSARVTVPSLKEALTNILAS